MFNELSSGTFFAPSNVQTNVRNAFWKWNSVVIVQSKDEDKSNQKGSMEVSFPTEDSRGAADQDEQSCAAGGLEVSSSRSGTTSERRVTRAAARSQQQRGRSSADGMITHIRAFTHFCF